MCELLFELEDISAESMCETKDRFAFAVMIDSEEIDLWVSGWVDEMGRTSEGVLTLAASFPCNNSIPWRMRSPSQPTTFRGMTLSF